jgi:hypothetical protein
MKMCPGLVSGCRIEIILESRERALGDGIGTYAGGGTPVTTYQVNDPVIIMMSHMLTDNSERVLNEESVENGLEYSYERVFTTANPLSQGTVNIQMKKAVSMANKAFAIPVLTSDYADSTSEESFNSNAFYANWQWRIGSAFYPQQRVDSDFEGMYTVLNAYSKNTTSGWWSSYLEYDTYKEATSVVGAGFETESALNLSGVPVNNSATCTLNATLASGEDTARTWLCFLEYTAVAKSFLTNVQVKI